MKTDIFPLSIWKARYDIFKTDYIKDVLFAKLESEFNATKDNNNPTMVNGTLCTYNQYAQIHELEEASDLCNFAENEAAKYWKELNYSSLLEPKLIQMWANRQPKGGSVRSHLHGTMPITAVLYVNAKKGCGNIVLQNPLESLLVSQPMDYDAQAFLHHEIEVKTGDFIMFPGWMHHYVKENTLDEDRLIIGMNFGSKGNYLAGQWITVQT